MSCPLIYYRLHKPSCHCIETTPIMKLLRWSQIAVSLRIIVLPLGKTAMLLPFSVLDLSLRLHRFSAQALPFV